MTRVTRLAVVALTAIVAAACSPATQAPPPSSSGGPAPSTQKATQMAAHGVEAKLGEIPWAQVGPGWLLAIWSPVTGKSTGQTPGPGEPTRETSTTSLYLVNPAGGRYAIATFPPPGEQAAPDLVDWSGDGSHALFFTRSERPTATMIDLHTGTQTTIDVKDEPRYTKPEGKALLISTSRSGDNPGTLERVDLTGKSQLMYPTDKLPGMFTGQYLMTPDGKQLVLGTTAGLVMMGNDGAAGAKLPVPNESDCSPLRWWDGNAGTTLLARCNDSQYVSRLWLVPIGGAAPSPLTAPNKGENSPDLADLNAWKLSAGTFVQAAGGCGFVYLAKLNPDGTTSQVAVPDVDNHKSVSVVGVDGGNLDLRASAACGGGQLVVNYDPAANKSTVLLGEPLNGGGVGSVLPYPGQG
ncbi:MAG: hypothetical protein QOH60_839 [Mycobacterium sp.]|jgi:TolB protein|nr:hypothetical protein [Mycobacterium sp.]